MIVASIKAVILCTLFCAHVAWALEYCDADCQIEDGHFCVKDDPHSFTVCLNGVRLATHRCQGGLWFDITQKACNWPSEIQGDQCPCIAPTRPPPTTAFTTTEMPKWTGEPRATRPPTPPELVRVCYLTNWSAKRPAEASFTADDVDPKMCTHIIVAFMQLDQGEISYMEDSDPLTLETLTRLRDEKNPSLKILVAIGGWDAGSSSFIEVVENQSSMFRFITQAISFLRYHDLDGLDIDWEYPTGYVSQYSTWIKHIKEGFEKEAAASGLNRLLLTAAVAAGTSTINNAYNVPDLSDTLDLILLMSYDLYGPWGPTTGLNSGLDGPGALNVQHAAKYWVQKGASPSKLAIGIPTYGRTFKVCNPDLQNQSPGVRSCGAGEVGAYTDSAGFEAYYETCLKLQCESGNWTSAWDEQGQAPYMYSGNQWVSYEDPLSIAAKVNFAKSNNFAGVMVWALDLDDFNDICGIGVKSPLMSTLVAVAKGQDFPGFIEYPNPSVNPCDPLNSGETGEVGGGSTTSGLAACDNNCEQTGFYCVPDNPEQFYQCVHGNRFPVQTCQSGLYFSSISNSCDWPENWPGCSCAQPDVVSELVRDDNNLRLARRDFLRRYPLKDKFKNFKKIKNFIM